MEKNEIIDNKTFYVMGNKMTNPLLTDFYLLTMLYAHWKNNRHECPAVFDMYYRKCPFGMNVIPIYILNSVVFNLRRCRRML